MLYNTACEPSGHIGSNVGSNDTPTFIEPLITWSFDFQRGVVNEHRRQLCNVTLDSHHVDILQVVAGPGWPPLAPSTATT